MKLSSLLILVFALSTCSASAQETRTLQFPADRSLGQLYTGPPASASAKDVGVFRDFQQIGPAKGAVQVPADTLIRLDVSMDACRDLSPLSKLPADAIHFLYFNVKAPVHNQVQHIAGLTGLRWLFFRSCPLKDSDMVHLAGLVNLERIQCSTYGFADDGYGITDASMSVFSNMPELTRLDLRANPITDDGLISLSTCDALESLSLSGSRVTGTGLDSLFMLPELRSLSFGVYDAGAPVDDEGMKVLAQLSGLEHLNLSATNVTDEGLSYINDLESLKSLTLDNTEISDAGLRHLVGLDELTKLRFYRKDGGDLGDEAAKHLSQLPKLADLTASWSLTSEGISHLAKAPALTDLSLSRPLTDDDLAEVAKMTALKDLSLQNCLITDTGIAHLESLQNLERLLLHGTKATPACIATLASLQKLTRLHLSLEQSGDAPYYWPNQADWDRIGELTNLVQLTLDGILLDERHWSAIAQLKNLGSLEVNTRVPIEGSSCVP